MGKASRFFTSSKDVIQPGVTGVFVTCYRNCEAKCTNDLYYLLNRAYEAIKSSDADPVKAEEKTESSFADQISSEVADLTNRKEKPFIALDTKSLQCIVFVKAQETINCIEVVEKLFEMIHDSAIKSIRYCQRILPIQKVVQAKIEDIRSAVTELAPPFFPEPTEYCVVFESRFNTTLDRMTVINMIAEIIGPKHKVNLNNPQKVIVVQVFKNLAAIAILSDWVKNRKYNAQEVLKMVIQDGNSEQK